MSSPGHLSYDSIGAWIEGEHLPGDWRTHSDIEQRNLWITQFAELREHLRSQHIASLTQQEQEELKTGQHPSLSWEFKDRAQPFTAALQRELASRGYVAEVSLGYYHFNNIVLHADLDRFPLGRLRGLPTFFCGFMVTYGFPDVQ